MAIIAFYGLEGGTLNWNGIPIYPRAYHPYGNDIMGPHSIHFKADIMISLIDAWVYEPGAFGPGRWVPWFPIDHDPAPKAVLNKVCPILGAHRLQSICRTPDAGRRNGMLLRPSRD